MLKHRIVSDVNTVLAAIVKIAFNTMVCMHVLTMYACIVLKSHARGGIRVELVNNCNFSIYSSLPIAS